MKDSFMPAVGKIKNNFAMPYDFSIKHILGEAWKRVHGSKTVYWKGIITFALMILGLIIIGGLTNYFLIKSFGITSKTHAIIWVWDTITYLILMPTMVGFSYLGIRRSVDLPIKVKQIFFPYNHYSRVIGVLVLVLFITYAIMLTGFFLNAFLIHTYSMNGLIPGWVKGTCITITMIATLIMYYFSFSFIFAPLLVVEKGFTVMQAIKSSFKAFNQHWFKIYITYFVMIIIYLVSAIPLGIGMIWTLPMFFNMAGVFYRTIFGVQITK